MCARACVRERVGDVEGRGRERSAWRATLESEEEDRAVGRLKAREGRWKGLGLLGECGEERVVAEERAACGGVLALSRWEREDGR